MISNLSEGDLYNISGATYEIISIPENKSNPRENRKVIEEVKEGEYLLFAESEKEMRKHPCIVKSNGNLIYVRGPQGGEYKIQLKRNSLKLRDSGAKITNVVRLQKRN
jgi:hypothetical protein